MSNNIQAVLFDKNKISIRQARDWLKKHKYNPIKPVHETKNYLRYRLKKPNKNEMYKFFSLPNQPSIKLILEYPKGGSKKISYQEATDIIFKLQKKVHGLLPTGSYVRKHDNLNDLDFLTLNDLKNIEKDLNDNFDIEIIRKGKKIIIFTLDGVKIDIWHVPSIEQLPYYMLEYGLGKEIISIKKRVRQRGYKLSIKGLQNLETGEYVKHLNNPYKILKYIDHLL
jgi:hypothetical protein